MRSASDQTAVSTGVSSGGDQAGSHLEQEPASDRGGSRDLGCDAAQLDLMSNRARPSRRRSLSPQPVTARQPQPSSGLVFNRRGWPTFRPALTDSQMLSGMCCLRFFAGHISAGQLTQPLGVESPPLTNDAWSERQPRLRQLHPEVPRRPSDAQLHPAWSRLGTR